MTKRSAISIAFILSTLFSLSQNIPANVPKNGLVGWWPFNGNANDESGQGRNGTATGLSLTADRRGNPNSAYEWKSNAGVNQSVAIGNLSPAFSASRSVSFSAWIYADQGIGYNPRIISFGSNHPGIWSLGKENTSRNYSGFWPPTGGVFVSKNVTSLAWHHVVFTSDVATGLTRFYVDGVPDTSFCCTKNDPSSSINGNWELGRQSPSEVWSGIIDDVGLWNRALTQDEVFQLFWGVAAAATSTVNTSAVSGISVTEAKCGGTVNITNGALVTARGVVWSTSSNPTVNLTTKTADGSGAGSFTSTLKGLKSNTRYFVRAYVTNRAGTVYGDERTFTTLVAPTLITSAVTDVRTTEAKTGGNITSLPQGSVIMRGVVWSTNPNPVMIESSNTFNGMGTGSFTSLLGDLQPNTRYYVRAYATVTGSGFGNYYGNEISFTTPLIDTGTNAGLTFGMLKDVDGNEYQTVQIGSQTWMSENLRVTKYRNGATISEVRDNKEWSLLTYGAWCYYSNIDFRNKPDGKLYNWYAVSNPNGLCPAGWHVPGSSEWQILEEYLGYENAGGKLKSTGTQYWKTPNARATNSTGFSGLPTGQRASGTGTFHDRGYIGYFWSATPAENNWAWARVLHHDEGTLIAGSDIKGVGMAVRCIKD